MQPLKLWQDDNQATYLHVPQQEHYMKIISFLFMITSQPVSIHKQWSTLALLELPPITEI